jgi:hypothetical protein
MMRSGGRPPRRKVVQSGARDGIMAPMTAMDAIRGIMEVAHGSLSGEVAPTPDDPTDDSVLMLEGIRFVFPAPPEREASDDTAVTRYRVRVDGLTASASVSDWEDEFQALERLEIDHGWELEQRGFEVAGDARDALGTLTGRAISAVRNGVVMQFREFVVGAKLVRATVVHTDSDAAAARFLRSLVAIDQPHEVVGDMYRVTFPAFAARAIEGSFRVAQCSSTRGACVMEVFEGKSARDLAAASLTEEKKTKLTGVVSVRTTHGVLNVFHRVDHEIALEKWIVLVREVLVRSRLFRLYACAADSALAQLFLDSFTLRDAGHLVLESLAAVDFPAPPKRSEMTIGAANVNGYLLTSPIGELRFATGAATDLAATFDAAVKSMAARLGEPAIDARNTDFAWAGNPQREGLISTAARQGVLRVAVVHDQAFIVQAITDRAPGSAEVGRAFVSSVGLGSRPILDLRDKKFRARSRWYHVEFANRPERSVTPRHTKIASSVDGVWQFLWDEETSETVEAYADRERYNHIAGGGVVLGEHRGVDDRGATVIRVCVAKSYDGPRQLRFYRRVHEHIVELRAEAPKSDVSEAFIDSFTMT